MTPQHPTPEWAIECFDKIIKTDDEDALVALLELLAGLLPAKADRYKYDASLTVIDYGYTKSQHCRDAGREFLGIAS
jgi:hypothetical protein